MVSSTAYHSLFKFCGLFFQCIEHIECTLASPNPQGQVFVLCLLGIDQAWEEGH